MRMLLLMLVLFLINPVFIVYYIGFMAALFCLSMVISDKSLGLDLFRQESLRLTLSVQVSALIAHLHQILGLILSVQAVPSHL